MRRAALCVGVNRYFDPEINPLEFAESDATELYDFFKRTAGYDDVRHLMAPDADQVLDCAREMVAQLGPGDLFVFFFAGHGYEFHKRHLLLCPKARLARLEYFHQTVPVDLLKQETGQTGVDRVFVLDACRTDLLKGRGGAGGLRGAEGFRNIVTMPTAPHSGALTILCGCDEGQQAREVPGLKQGLFTRALIEELEAAVQVRAELRLDDRLESALQTRMSRLAEQFGLSGQQRPWIKRSGGVPVLFEGQVATTAGRTSSSAAVEVGSSIELRRLGQASKCPMCGQRNLEKDTFQCRVCGRDYLCKRHFDEEHSCCRKCAAKLKAEKAARQGGESSGPEGSEKLFHLVEATDGHTSEPTGSSAPCVTPAKWNCESIIAGIDPSDEKTKKRLERLVSDHELGPVIRHAASEDYIEWYTLFRAYLSAKAVEEKAKWGELEDKEREMLMAVYTTRVAKHAKRRAAHRETDTENQEDIYRLTYHIVMRGAHGDKMREMSIEMTTMAVEQLARYEKETGKNIIGFVTSAVSKLAIGDAEQVLLARKVLSRIVGPT